MAKPLIPVEVIHDHALALIDAEGAQALNARRLWPPTSNAPPARSTSRWAIVRS